MYRLVDFFEDKDVELLLGVDVSPEIFSGYNLGRVLDRIYEAGSMKIFSQIAQNALDIFAVDTRRVHFDATSISVYGDYDVADPPFIITYGHSKDKRPDLKQFLLSLLCVDHNIPILGGTKGGNASDKTINNEVLSTISTHMATHGLTKGYVYVTDSAFVTPANLEKARDNKIAFLSRLPATYSECGRVIQEAVAKNVWTDIGTLAEEGTDKRQKAVYRATEKTLALRATAFGKPSLLLTAPIRLRLNRLVVLETGYAIFPRPFSSCLSFHSGLERLPRTKRLPCGHLRAKEAAVVQNE